MKTPLKIFYNLLPKPQNIIPLAMGGADKNVAIPATVTFPGAGSDADGTIDPNGYRWRQVSGPSTLAGLPVATKDLSLSLPSTTVQGTYVLGFITTDNTGAHSIEDTVTLVAYKEDPVVITPPPVVVVPPKLVAVALSSPGSVNEGSSVTLSLSGIYEGGTVALITSGIEWSANAPNGVFSPAANSVVGDSYQATITATAGGFTASRGVQVVDKTVVVAPPSGERITGELPVDVNFDLVSLQNPPQPTISTLFSAPIDQPVQPPDYYGAMYNPADVRHYFPVGSNPLVKELWFGRYQGDLSSRYFRVSGERADGTLVQLVNFAPIPGDPSLPDFVPGKGYVFPVAPDNYAGLYYSINGNAKPWSFRVYAEYTPIAARAKPVLTKWPLKYAMGPNVHAPLLLQDLQDPNVRDQIPAAKQAIFFRLSGPRVYQSSGNINTSPGVYQFDQDSQGFHLDRMYKQLYEASPDYIMAPENITPDIYRTYPDDGNYERVPIRSGRSQTDPTAWEEYAEQPAQISYRYGNNKNVPLSRIKARTGLFYPTDPSAGSWTVQVGLGIMRYMEIMLQEGDRYWKFGENTTLIPAGAAVGAKVVYDRVKEYNPDMTLILMGQASFAPDWTSEVARESRIRHGMIPCDEYQVHFYPTTGGSQYSNEPTVAVTVENSYGPALAARWHDFNYHRMGNKPTGIGEGGADCTTNSPIRAVVPAGSNLTQRQWAGVLYLRLGMWTMKNGFKYFKPYEGEDNSPTNQYVQFAAMGGTYQMGVTPNVKLLPFPWVCLDVQLNTLAGECIHQEELSTTPLVDRWQEPSGRTVYSLHMPTESNATGSYTLSLPNGGTRYDFSYDSFTPKATTLAAGTVTLPLTEVPCFVVDNAAPAAPRTYATSYASNYTVAS